jgi:cold-inducible RNA-binding protein
MRLFVGNVSYRASEDDLHAVFANAGIPVDSVSLVRDRETGESRGFAFAEVADNTAGERAIQACNGAEFMGRALVVNEARPRQEGGGGRGGFRGDRERW